MSTTTGRTQYVEQGASGSLSYRLLDDITLDEISLSATLSASTLTIYGRGGSVLVSAVNPTSVSGAVATYARTWTTATFQRLRGYRAVWTLSDGTDTYTRTQYFEVTRRIFRSQLTDTDFTSRIPYLSSRLPSGQSDFSIYREDAWREIQDRLAAALPEIRSSHEGINTNNYSWGHIDSSYPGNVFNPEQFFDAHRYLTVAMFLEAIAISGDGVVASSDEREADRRRERYEESFLRASSALALDIDDDGVMDESEREYNYASIERVR